MKLTTVLVAVALTTVVSGCSVDSNYIREGIGTNLSAPDLLDASYLQDVYVGEICRQAGLRFTQHGDVRICDEVTMRPAEWATFVQAGMNDIDRRCDAYLTWLDNKRRWREPILKQINTTAAATGAILGLTGVGAVPIAIVATAFGFAQDSFVNFETRLITEIDHTVIQAVVLGHQLEYRAKLAKVLIDNRPEAIYLLRNYLRICMPMSIEMSINNTIITYHRAGPESLRSAPILTRAPMVAAHVIGAGPIIRNDQPLQRGQPGPQSILNPIGNKEPTISRRTGINIQNTLCVSPATGDFGTVGSDTRIALQKFYWAVYSQDPSTKLDHHPGEITNDKDLKTAIAAVSAFPSCSRAGFRDAYEVGIFNKLGFANVRDALRRAIQIAAKDPTAPDGIKTSKYDPAASNLPTVDQDARNAISELRKFHRLLPGDVIDHDFYFEVLLPATFK